MSKEQVKTIQEASIALERQVNDLLGDVRDPQLATPLADGRILRSALQEVAEHYQEHVQQLLWTKWGQRIERSEARVLLAELQGARAAFIAYLSDLEDAKLDVGGNVAAHGATPREVATHVLEEERKTVDLIIKALAG